MSSGRSPGVPPTREPTRPLRLSAPVPYEDEDEDDDDDDEDELDEFAKSWT